MAQTGIYIPGKGFFVIGVKNRYIPGVGFLASTDTAAVGGANPKGPFGHPFHGPFGGPI